MTATILAAAGITLMLAIGVPIARDGATPEHPGADEAYADELRASLADDTTELPAFDYAGRHHEDTVEIVTPDYRPPLYSPAFAAAMGYPPAGAAS